MQQLNGTITNAGTADSFKKQIRLLFPALSWVCGLLLAGSDGSWMPYVNVAGGLVFLGATLWLGRALPELEKDLNSKDTSACSRNRYTGIRAESQPIKPRYARELGVV